MPRTVAFTDSEMVGDSFPASLCAVAYRSVSSGNCRRPAAVFRADAKRFRGVLARVNQEGLRELPVERDTTIQSLAVEAFNDLLRGLVIISRRPYLR